MASWPTSFKQAEELTPIGLIDLLLGAGEEARRLADSHVVLRRQFPEMRLRLRYLQTRLAPKT